MRWMYGSILFMIVCCIGGHTAAQGLVPPTDWSNRTAILPPAYFEGAPGSIGHDDAFIANFGDTTLKLSYLDPGDKTWHPVEIAARQRVAISCPKCGKEISVSFHDGFQDQRLTINKGEAHALYWSITERRWRIGPYESVQRILMILANPT